MLFVFLSMAYITISIIASLSSNISYLFLNIISSIYVLTIIGVLILKVQNQKRFENKSLLYIIIGLVIVFFFYPVFSVIETFPEVFILKFFVYFALFGKILEYPLQLLMFIVFVVSLVFFIMYIYKILKNKKVSNEFLFQCFGLLFLLGLIYLGVENYIDGTLINYDVPKNLREYRHHFEPIIISVIASVTMIVYIIRSYVVTKRGSKI